MTRWQTYAPCVGDHRATSPDPEAARAVIAQHCGTCPVLVECAAWALTESTHGTTTGYEGVAGGMWWVDGHPKQLPRHTSVYAPTEVAAGHSAWVCGQRDEHVRQLEREYQRLRHIARKKARTGAA